MSATTSGDEAEPTDDVPRGILEPATVTSVAIGGSWWAKAWITVVACMAVALVMASMVALTLGLSLDPPVGPWCDVDFDCAAWGHLVALVGRG
jgi:hypothetical protein